MACTSSRWSAGSPGLAEEGDWQRDEDLQAREPTKDDPLGPLFRIVLLRGARRGEAAGLRWPDSDLDSGYVRVRRPIVLVRGAVTESTPKTAHYTHIEAEAHKAAAEAVAKLVESASS
ncbi:hypothetical protein EAS64_39890 [Trebonia kvetii]|uniref:Tyr recombinase domain-containing protein n=1 Tax=Trebonia kvetii TaxID=2480626 RepID=A0A6P2BL82_9ACTN|nr:hypothetical protein [Trebonia kvetii]TVY99818.1 hypothetical protein EAS64_39890 [Trebonia kvetii]